MSRIGAMMGAPVPQDTGSDSDDSGEEGGGGFRIAADPNPFPRAKFATQGGTAVPARAPANPTPAPVAAPKPSSGGFATPATFAVPPRKKSPNEFIPSSTFNGPKPGFIFKKGPDGMGYYKDSNFAQNNVGTSLTNASRAGSGLPGTQSSGSKDMLQLLKAKEIEENSKPKSSTIPFDDVDSDEDDPDMPQPPAPSKTIFGKMTKKITKSAEEIRANIKRRQEEAAAKNNGGGSTVGGGGGSTVPPAFSAPPPVAKTAPPAPVRSSPPSPAPRTTAPPPVQPRTPVVAATPVPAPSPTPKANGTKQRNSPDAMVQVVCEDLGFGLPQAVMGLPGFTNVLRIGNLLHTSAHGPQLPTQGYVRGRVGKGGMAMDNAQVAASLTTLSVLKSLTEELGGLDSIKGCVKINGQVACTDSDSSSLLLETFSPMAEILKAIFSCGEPVISVSGVTCLPHEIPLQAEFVFELQ